MVLLIIRFRKFGVDLKPIFKTNYYNNIFMKSLTVIMLLFLIVTESFGQIKYEKGYFINNENKKIECLIKNKDWKNNPSEFSYKLKDSRTPLNGDLISVKEFGIYNFCKFVGADVKIDRSINPKTTITTEKNPLWKQEKLFLKVLVDGKAKLYAYEGNNLVRYFYSMNGGKDINQLVYKEYKVDLTLVKNTSFRQQIWKDLQFKDSYMDEVKNMNYTSDELVKYFKSYNSSFGETATEITPKAKKSYLNLKLAPGINFSSGSMSFPNALSLRQKTQNTYKTNPTFRAGLEAEWVFSYHKFKWAVVFEPTFQSFNSDTAPEDGSIKYSSVEFPVGVRYYYHLNENTRLYVNGFYIPGIAANFNSQTVYQQNTGQDIVSDIKAKGNVAIGGGIDYNKLSLEARYYTDRTLLKDNLQDASYSRFSIVIGYKIFTTKH